MDELAALLDGPRARGAFTLKVVMSAPWGLAVRDEAPLTVLAVTTGEAWLRVADSAPSRLLPGDVALLCGPEPYVVADSPDTVPGITILPGQVCVGPDGQHLAQTMSTGLSTWGSPDGETTMLVGTYASDGEVGRRLVDALPRTLVRPAAESATPLVGLLAAELTAEHQGRGAALDRLVDLLVIDLVRTWARDEASPGWLTGGADPCVAEALRLIQDDYGQPWTVASLARTVGLSRAAFARRFTEAVGRAPIAYLTDWRMAVAADLLHEPGRTVTSVAAQVGYPSPFTFSAAYKRHFGASPRHHLQASA
ncbi:AraC family transcriptional regulator [Microlunatus aurantiacus]|uniref:AraC family transcriptional regulator n=1 Tax=Microlunatus aurantiacus TaxID=446786 RepID=A0ABP7CJX1_9ACTN